MLNSTCYNSDHNLHSKHGIASYFACDLSFNQADATAHIADALPIAQLIALCKFIADKPAPRKSRSRKIDPSKTSSRKPKTSSRKPAPRKTSKRSSRTTGKNNAL